MDMGIRVRYLGVGALFRRGDDLIISWHYQYDEQDDDEEDEKEGEGKLDLISSCLFYDYL